jgi:hypothetical protein
VSDNSRIPSPRQHRNKTPAVPLTDPVTAKLIVTNDMMVSAPPYAARLAVVLNLTNDVMAEASPNGDARRGSIHRQAAMSKLTSVDVVLAEGC